ncbi:hypothetical protein Pcinc_037879 [Petrolisthes cinctipes]|uniref:T-cell immunomodulatory protein TIP C2 domain-containing protein n=1 Tax=Petrolisthes cinctipes TaxID=88211 RepID=A0AAE1EKX7_PETCI|nr:hypothetical protein Pcinc_037879 [Petrolisthes cinctipes]
MKFTLVVRVVCIILCLSVCPSKGEDITDLVFGNNNNYLPAAFGDFNSDRRTDLFVVSEDGKTVEVLLSHSEPPYLRPSDTGTLKCSYNGLNIRSVVPGDFDGDGAMDILILSLNTSVSPLHQVFISWGNLTSLTCAQEDSPTLSLFGEPLVFDYNGDMIPDLFGEDFSSRKYWVFGPDRKPPKVIPMPVFTTLPNLKFPSSHAFIDLNYDLAADLWISTESGFEIWRRKRNDYAFHSIVSLPPDAKLIGQTSFADLNGDGTIEAIVPVCKDVKCYNNAIYIYNFKYKVWTEMDIDFVDLRGNSWTFKTDSKNISNRFNTITLRMGDFNLDGYTDFLVTLYNGDKARVTLVENMARDEEWEEEGDEVCAYNRMFVPRWNLFDNFGDTVLGAFSDFDDYKDSVSPDVLLVGMERDGRHHHLHVYRDMKQSVGFYIKVMITSGRCFRRSCRHHNTPYGTNPTGPSLKFTIPTQDMTWRNIYGTQITQTAHTALQLPYQLFGLGDNLNYIDEMKVGMVTDRNDTNRITYDIVELVPTSKIIIIPNPVTDSGYWRLETYLTALKKNIIISAVVKLGMCICMGVALALL